MSKPITFRPELGKSISPVAISKRAADSSISQSSDLTAKRLALEAWFAPFKRVVIAFSGGVDSSLVAWLAGRQLGKQALAVTADSTSLKRSDLALCYKLTQQWGLSHRVIHTEEMSRADYRANGADRCYICKSTLFARLSRLAKEAVILSGTNADDLRGHRPGLRAAAEFMVRAPLAECGIGKQEVRALAHFYQLKIADKPQTPCLASRVAYGLTINPQLLQRIEVAEEWLHSLGFSQLRVRHHGEVARLEVLPVEFKLLLEKRQMVQRKLSSLGWTYISLDLLGFRSGAMNEVLSEKK